MSKRISSVAMSFALRFDVVKARLGKLGFESSGVLSREGRWSVCEMGRNIHERVLWGDDVIPGEARTASGSASSRSSVVG